jgi:hypothetical protein
MGIVIQAPADLDGDRRAAVVAELHQGPEVEVGHDQAPREQGSQRVVLTVEVGAHGKRGTGAGRVVHVHDRLGAVQLQDLENLLRQPALLVIEGTAKAAVEVAGARQHAVPEQRLRQRRVYRGDDADHVDGGTLPAQ